MMKRIWVAVPLLLALGACHTTKAGVFAQRRGAPNEFVVGRSAPLVVPPDFALVPPRPGAPRPQETDSSTQALNAPVRWPGAGKRRRDHFAQSGGQCAEPRHPLRSGFAQHRGREQGRADQGHPERAAFQ